MSNDYFKAQGWFKNYALNSQDSRGVFQQLVKEDEEAFRLASAESDKLKEELNKNLGPGTIKYGSEISQPPKRPDVIEIELINDFMKRNPAAEGGRMGFNKGLSAKQKKALTITYPKDSTKDLEIKKTGEYPVNISKEGNSFRVKLLNGKRKSVKDLDAAIELLKSDGQTVKYLGADQKQVLDWIKSQTEPITTDDIAKYISDNDLSVRRNKITSIIKDNPEYEGKVELVKEYKANFLNKDGTIKQGTVDEITKMINNPEDFSTMQAIAKKLNYKGTIKNVINQWSAQTGNDIPFERFRVHTYRDTEIAEKIIKAFDEQGDNPNIAKLARKFQNEMPGVNSFNSARNQIRKILVDYADYEPRPNEPKSANEMSYYKKRRQNISLALKRMGDTSIKGQMDEMLYNKNQEYIKLANENPDKILNDKKLRFALETTVDVDTGEFKIRNNGKGLSDNEILEKVKRGDLFTEDHITEVKTAETAPKKSGEGVKLTKGVNIEYPTNKQAVTINFNQSFLPNAQKYLTENPNGKNVQKIENVLNDYGLQIKVGNKTYGTTEKIAWDSKTKTSPRYDSNFNIFDSSAQNIDYVGGKKDFVGFSSGFNTDLFMKDKAVQKILNSKAGQAVKNAARGTAGTVGKVFGGIDIVLGALDYENNISKGQKEGEALRNAVQAMSFNLYKTGDRARIEDVKERFVAKGGDGEIFNQATALNAKDQEINDLIFANKKKADTFVRYAKEGRGTLTPDLEKSKADYEVLKKNLNAEIAEKISERDNMVESYKTNLRVSEAGAPIQIGGNEFFSQPFKDIKQSTMDKIAEENRKAYDMQKRQVNYTSGNIGNFLQNNIFTMNPQEKAELQRQINNMDERELYKFNLSRGMDPDNLIRFEDILRYKTNDPSLMGVNTTKYVNYDDRKAEGGIIGLRSKYEYKK